jgi:N-acetylglucosamine kinase-like BadF-type ATPase
MEGEILGKGQAGASNYQSVGEAAAKNALQIAIHDAFSQAGQPIQKIDCLCMGLAGYGRDFEKRFIKEWAKKTNFAHQVLVVNDADLLLWAGTPEGWGLALLCGTGSIAVGRTPQGITTRAGGWGYLIGDEGSGYALGIAALRAAVMSADGRNPPTQLQQGVLAALELTQVEELVAYIYQDNPSREEIARLAGVVFSAAEKGEHQANMILGSAATELVKTAQAVYSKLRWQGSIPCALGGGVFLHNPEFVQRVINVSDKSGLQIEPIEVVAEPVIGAVKLAIHSMKSEVHRNQQ